MSDVSRDLWLKALADVATPPEDDQDAMTASEFGELFGCAMSTSTARLKKLLAAKRVTRCTKRIQAADGRWLRVSAYRLTDGDVA